VTDIPHAENSGGAEQVAQPFGFDGLGKMMIEARRKRTCPALNGMENPLGSVLASPSTLYVQKL
jgi:hypothetical protein